MSPKFPTEIQDTISVHYIRPNYYYSDYYYYTRFT